MTMEEQVAANASNSSTPAVSRSHNQSVNATAASKQAVLAQEEDENEEDFDEETDAEDELSGEDNSSSDDEEENDEEEYVQLDEDMEDDFEDDYMDLDEDY